jgi:glutaredoxin
MPGMLISRIKGSAKSSGSGALFRARLFILAGVIIVFIPALTGAILFSQKTPVALYVFDSCGGCNVQNPCKPCTLFIEQINKCKRLLKENNLLDRTEFKPYNVYMNNDAAVYKNHMAAMGLEEAPSLPAVLIGGMLISGRDELENLAAAVKAERRFIPLLKQFLRVSEKEKIKMGVYDELTVVNFSLPYCEDCIRTDSFLESFADIKIIKIYPSDAAGRLLYERYCKIYGVPINDYAAPRLFIQRNSFLGYEEVSLSLENVLRGNFKTVKIEMN